MRILIFTQKLDKNDTILGFFHNWLREFAKQCETLTVICLKKGTYDLSKKVKVLSLGKERGRSRLKYLINFYKYIWRERKNYDAVFVHMNQIYVILGGLFWKLWGKKISLWYAHGKIDWRLRLAEKLADIIFTSTKEGFRIKSKRVKIVGQGIDVGKFKPGKRKKTQFLKIVSVGRISPAKDYETLIRATDQLKDIDLKVEIIGGIGLSEDRIYLEEMKKLIREKNLGNVIKFIGPKPNQEIIKFLQSADLFVNMGQTGSLDKAVLEAMACEILVLTCNEAFREILGQYVPNLMYRKKDFHQLSEKIRSIAKLNSQEKEKISRDLRKIVIENHSLANLIKKICRYLKTNVREQ